MPSSGFAVSMPGSGDRGTTMNKGGKTVPQGKVWSRELKEKIMRIFLTDRTECQRDDKRKTSEEDAGVAGFD